MAVARVASAEDIRTGTTDPHTFSYAGTTPQGIAIAIMHGVSGTTLVTSVSYGGVALTKIIGAADTSTEPGIAEFWFLGVGVPTGTQTVSIDLTSGSTTDIHTVVWELSGATDLEVTDRFALNNNVANPTAAMVASGLTKLSLAALYTGTDAPGGTLAAGNTLDHTHDHGAFSTQTCYETTVDNANHTIGWSTLASDDVAFVAISVAEATAEGYIHAAGRAFSYTSTPDHNDFDVVNTLDARMLVAMDDWTPAAEQALFAKRNDDTVTFNSYMLTVVATTGRLKFQFWDATGGAQAEEQSSVSPTVSDLGALWVRVTFEGNVGGVSNVKFYTSADPITTAPASVTWAQLGTTRVGGTAKTLNVTASKVTIGARNNGDNDPMFGKIYYGPEISGTVGGTVVSNPDFRYDDQRDSTTQLTDDFGKVWTVTANQWWVNPSSAATPATVTPAVVATVTTIPTPSVLAAALVAPTVIARSFTVPTPTVAIPGLVTPAVVALTTTVPTPTVLVVAVVTPAVVATVVTVPTPTVLAAALVTPAVVATVVTVPTPVASIPGIATPAVIAMTTTVPTPDITAEALATPAVVATTTTIPTPTVTAASTVTPSVVAVVATVPTPKILNLGYLNLTGDAGAHATTPDHVSLDGFSTGIDIRVLVAVSDWTQGAPGDEQNFVAKWAADTTASATYRFQVRDSGVLRYMFWDGASSNEHQSSIAVPAVDGEYLWLRVTQLFDNGSSQNEAKFYYSTDPIYTDPASVSWTQLGSTQTGGVKVQNVSDAEVFLGAYNDVSGETTGHLAYAEIRDGINGTIVADPDWRYDCQQDSSTQLTDDQGRVWTVNSTATWAIPAPCPFAPATVTPAVVAVISTVPTPVVSIPATTQPAVVATVVTVPTPVISIPGTVTPAVVPLTVTVPTPTVTAASVVTPAVVGAVTTVPTPTVTVAPTVTPATVATVTTIPTPTITAASVVTPAVVATVTTIPTPAVLAAASVTPLTVAAATTVPTPTILIAPTVTPATVAAVTTVPTPTVLAASVVEPAVVVTLVTVPTPTVTVAPTVTPAVVATVVTVPAPTVIAAAVVTPDSVAAVVDVPNPVVTVGATATPATVEAVSTVPTPQVVAESVVTPDVVATVVTVPTPATQGGTTVQPDVIVTTVAVPTPSVTAASVVTPTVVTVVSTVDTPTVQAEATVTLATVGASTTVPTPSITAAAVVTPATVAVVSTVPPPDVLTAGAVVPATVTVTSTVPTPTVLAGALTQPAVVGMTVTVPTPTISGGVAVQPETVNLTTTIPTPTVTIVGAGFVAPATVVVTVTVPPPTGEVIAIFSPPGDGIDCGPADRNGTFTTVNSIGVLADYQLSAVGSANRQATVTNGGRAGRMRRVRIKC